MASKFLNSTALKATRNYAAHAATKTKPTAGEGHFLPREPLKTTTLNNGVVVASVETNAPVSRVGIAFKVGSRDEPVGAEGLVHTLRTTAGLTTKNSTQFGITRTVQQAGATLSCTAGREQLLYAVDGTRNNIDDVLPKLSDVALHPAFKPWELSDNAFRVQLDLAALEPQVKALELLHKAAFRTGLGNSLFCPNYMVGKHTPDQLHQFTAANLHANNAAVIGVGVPHDGLVAYAQSLAFHSGETQVKDSKICSGDVRLESSGPLAFVAIATEGASLADTRKMIAFALLQRVLGTGPATKRGMGAGSKLTQAVLGALDTNAPCAVSALNLNYSDSGLFGFVAAAPASAAGRVVSAAVKAMRSVQIDGPQLSRAKAQLKADLLMSEESSAGLFEEVALQSLFNKGKTISTSAELLAAVDQVTAAEVNAVATKVSSGKLAMGAFGNLTSTPYADQL